MSTSTTAHKIEQVEVNTGDTFVAVIFTTANSDTVTLFFPDHAAVQRMIENLTKSANAARV